MLLFDLLLLTCLPWLDNVFRLLFPLWHNRFQIKASFCLLEWFEKYAITCCLIMVFHLCVCRKNSNSMLRKLKLFQRAPQMKTSLFCMDCLSKAQLDLWIQVSSSITNIHIVGFIICWDSTSKSYHLYLYPIFRPSRYLQHEGQGKVGCMESCWRYQDN